MCLNERDAVVSARFIVHGQASVTIFEEAVGLVKILFIGVGHLHIHALQKLRGQADTVAMSTDFMVTVVDPAEFFGSEPRVSILLALLFQFDGLKLVLDLLLMRLFLESEPLLLSFNQLYKFIEADASAIDISIRLESSEDTLHIAIAFI